MSFANHPLKSLTQSLMAPTGPTVADVATDMHEENRERIALELAKKEDMDRRLALREALMEADVDTLMEEMGIVAAQKRAQHESELKEAGEQDKAKEILQVLGTAKSSSRNDMALVGFDSPGDTFREVYLQKEKPDARDRARRAGIGGTLGLGLAGLGLGVMHARKAPLNTKKVLGTLAAGLGIGGAGGALFPARVMEGYDPDLLIEVPEREERMAKAVLHALKPGEMPNNTAFDTGMEGIRGFHGGGPTFAYATDIDEMLEEQPDTAASIFKSSAAYKGLVQRLQGLRG